MKVLVTNTHMKIVKRSQRRGALRTHLTRVPVIAGRRLVPGAVISVDLESFISTPKAFAWLSTGIIEVTVDGKEQDEQSLRKLLTPEQEAVLDSQEQKEDIRAFKEENEESGLESSTGSDTPAATLSDIEDQPVETDDILKPKSRRSRKVKEEGAV